MTKQQFYLLLDEVLELDPGSIKGNERLADIPKWDSLAIMGFIAMLDQQFGLIIPAANITSCATMAELVTLAGQRVI